MDFMPFQISRTLLETPQQAEKRKRQQRLYMREKRSNETLEEKKQRQEKQRLNRRLQLKSETPEQAERRKLQQKMYMRKKRASATPEEAAELREKNRIRGRLKRSQRTPDEQESDSHLFEENKKRKERKTGVALKQLELENARQFFAIKPIFSNLSQSHNRRDLIDCSSRTECLAVSDVDTHQKPTSARNADANIKNEFSSLSMNVASAAWCKPTFLESRNKFAEDIPLEEPNLQQHCANLLPIDSVEGETLKQKDFYLKQLMANFSHAPSPNFAHKYLKSNADNTRKVFNGKTASTTPSSLLPHSQHINQLFNIASKFDSTIKDSSAISLQAHAVSSTPDGTETCIFPLQGNEIRDVLCSKVSQDSCNFSREYNKHCKDNGQIKTVGDRSSFLHSLSPTIQQVEIDKKSSSCRATNNDFPLQIPSHSSFLMRFLPTSDCDQFLALLGLEKAVDELKCSLHETSPCPQPSNLFQCFLCESDVSAEWRVIDCENLLCQQCFVVMKRSEALES
ncbi:uncharacterized protein LOC143461989 isoform X1 [Clavelina lepadiformis]|uniref:uncharacterized protein LOC143461989 isoform X1 n=1 Tax=Clavelina lepadiformis TaxID=159417 RepID=UPI00404151E7